MKRIYRNESETSLINLVKSDNKRESDNAIAEIIHRNEGSLKLYIMRRVYETQEREDIYNEALERMWKKIELFDPSKGKISTWLFTIAHNLIVDSIRKKKSVVRLEDINTGDDGDDNSVEFEIPDYSQAPSDKIEKAQRNKFIRAALDKTFTEDDNRRIVFELRFISQLTYEEIVERTNFSLGSVKAWIHRTKQEFSKNLKEEMGTELRELVEV